MVKRVSNRKVSKKVHNKTEDNNVRVVVRRGKNKTRKEMQKKKINKRKEVKVSKQKKSTKQSKSKKVTKPRKQRQPRQSKPVSEPVKLIALLPSHTPIINIDDIFNKNLSDFNIMDILLSILEIGHYPIYYNLSNPNSETKSFWDYIISHSKYKNLFSISPFKTSLNLSSDNIRKFYSYLQSYEIKSVVQILENNQQFLISKQDPFNLLTIADYIKTIINGQAKEMNELDTMIEIEIPKEIKVIEKEEIKQLTEKDNSFAKTISHVTDTISSEFPHVDKNFINKMLFDNETNIAMTYKLLKDNTI